MSLICDGIGAIKPHWVRPPRTSVVCGLSGQSKRHLDFTWYIVA